MAQRMIHYLFGELLSERINVKDKNRFLLGSVLPDAYIEGHERGITHFICNSDQQVYFDFEQFRKQFKELIRVDALYMGYYMHLVEDAFYRKFIQDNQLKRPCCQAEIILLHNDYHLLNSYIVKKYTISNTIVKPKDFDEESIGTLAKYDVDKLIKDMEHDFIEEPKGNSNFITENLLDEFVDKYMIFAIKEMQALLSDKKYLKPVDYAWKINN